MDTPTKPTLKKPRIVTIGGGTGTFVVLRGLKLFPCDISVIVTMSDSGGSNKRIRDEFGLLPTSDIRQCLVALADESGGVELLRKLFMYRFEKGEGISGMTFGNLFMAALSDILGSQQEAIRKTGKVLRVHGKIIPVSFTDTNLHAQYEDGRILQEEHLIDEPPHDGTLKITRVYLDPPAEANPEALDAIKRADMIVLGPGDLFTSVIPNLLVGGISKAISQSKAKKVYIMNLMTKFGQTYNFTASDHIRALSSYLGQTPDCIVMNTTPLPKEALTFYKAYHELPLVDDLADGPEMNIVRADLTNSALYQKPKSDTLMRSLIRHDSDKLAQALMNLIP